MLLALSIGRPGWFQIRPHPPPQQAVPFGRSLQTAGPGEPLDWKRLLDLGRRVGERDLQHAAVCGRFQHLAGQHYGRCNALGADPHRDRRVDPVERAQRRQLGRAGCRPVDLRRRGNAAEPDLAAFEGQRGDDGRQRSDARAPGGGSEIGIWQSSAAPGELDAYGRAVGRPRRGCLDQDDGRGHWKPAPLDVAASRDR